MRASETGSALLLVAGATAAVLMLALVLLGAALTSYETAAMRRDGVQARLLAEAAIARLAGELAAGRVVAPRQVGASLRRQGVPPAPPPGAATAPGDCGFRVTLQPVPGPSGARRQRTEEGPGPLLLDAFAEGWCGRGYRRVEARFALPDEGGPWRLY